MIKWLDTYPSPARFWIINQLYVMVFEPDQVKVRGGEGKVERSLYSGGKMLLLSLFPGDFAQFRSYRQALYLQLLRPLARKWFIHRPW